MVFPDYYFFAERRLVNHTIDEKRVKNLDDCELFCYLNDDYVSLDYKKDPENDKTGYNCQLNNATHLKCDSDLTTDAKFYYRGSKVSYRSIFHNYRLGIIHKQYECYANSRAFDHSVFGSFFHSNSRSFFSYFVSLCFCPSERLW